MRISDWSSDVCSSDLLTIPVLHLAGQGELVILLRQALAIAFDHAADRYPPDNGRGDRQTFQHVDVLSCWRRAIQIDATRIGSRCIEQPVRGGRDRKSTRLNSSH